MKSTANLCYFISIFAVDFIFVIYMIERKKYMSLLENGATRRL